MSDKYEAQFNLTKKYQELEATNKQLVEQILSFREVIKKKADANNITVMLVAFDIHFGIMIKGE